jgi:uncharacterized protein (DUF934 family)
MPLIKNGDVVSDPYRALADDAPLPEGEAVLVSLTRWTAERDRLTARNAPVGVRLKSSESPSALAQDLAHIALIAIEFPGFRDGRGFSYAHRLRKQYGFTGELRAMGHLIPDQAQFLIRCGFDSIAVKETARLPDWQRGVSEFTVWYQPAADARKTVLALRHGKKQAAE